MPEKPKILIVEDHENIRRSLKVTIEQDGYDVVAAENLAEAEKSLAFRPDLIVLDWMLSDGQGLDFLLRMRTIDPQRAQIPVIFLTARAELVDIVLGLEMGASDYITKPFEPRELLARIRVRLRERSAGVTPSSDLSQLVQVGALMIDKRQHQVKYRDQTLELVKKEFDLLVLFAENPGRVFSRDEILNKVWGYDVFPTTRTVDSHVMLLRQKLTRANAPEDLIETVRAVGYRLRAL